MSAPGLSEASAFAARLRSEFDRGFAAPRAPADRALCDFVAIGLAGESYALPLAAIAALHADRKILRLPSAAPELLGFGVLGGAVLPVYDLRLLLAHAAASSPRWLLAVAGSPLALAFDAFEGHLRVPRGAVTSVATRDAAHGHVSGAVQTPVQLRRVIDVASIVSRIRALATAPTPEKER
ncbi:MAG: chemotaxis protein CheW [Myxococcota bacterium]